MKHHYRMIPSITEYCLAVSVPCFSQTPSPPAWGYQGHPTQTWPWRPRRSCGQHCHCPVHRPPHAVRRGHAYTCGAAYMAHVATVASSCGPSSIGKLCSASCSLRVWAHRKWFDGNQRRQRLRSASLNCSWRSSTWARAHSWPWPWLTVAMLRETRAVEHEPHAVPVWQGISDRKRPWSCKRINRQLQRCRAQFASLSLEMPTHWCSKT